MTLGARIDALSAADLATLRQVLRDVLASEETIRDRMHGDRRVPGAKVRADVLKRVLGGER